MAKETQKTKKTNTKEIKEVKKTSKKTTAKKTASKKEVKKVKKQGLFKRIGNWINSVFKEVSKVKWPSKKEMLKYSIATIVFVVFFGLFFYAIEFVMALLKSLV